MTTIEAPRREQRAERIRVVCDPALPGLQLLKAENSVREWKVFNTVHSISISDSWVSSVKYRGRVSEVTPGSVFCTEPGEAHTTSRPAVAGALRVLMIDEAPLREQLAELGFHARHIHFAETVTRKVAPQLKALMGLLGTPGPTPLELQSAFVDLASAVAPQLLVDGHTLPNSKDDCTELADDMRDLLHATVHEGASLTLDELASAAKLSKFRALRAFKRRHGIPPHTYELCLRLSRARDLLRTGKSVAATATECGFADQSHMTRHFSRYYGYPPGRYAREAAPPPPARGSGCQQS